jgi:hypothetical protein
MNNTRRHFAFLIALLLVAGLPVVAPAQFQYTSNNGAITITLYTGSGGAVIIPSSVNGLPVTGIGTNAFLNNFLVTSIFIPDTVTNIAYRAFVGCTKVRNVTFSANIATIGGGAFFNCGSLTNVVIPDPVTTIGDQASSNSSGTGGEDESNRLPPCRARLMVCTEIGASCTTIRG